MSSGSGDDPESGATEYPRAQDYHRSIAPSQTRLAPSAGPDRRVKVWVACLLVLLAVPGLIGFELWPLTGWRMYSTSASASRLDWAVIATTPDGEIDLRWTDLPLAYRLAAWQVAESYAGSSQRRDATCHALLEGVRANVPEASGVVLVRSRDRLRGSDGDVVHERERFYRCGDA